MYKRLACDWFLSCADIKRIRLDAPKCVAEALADAGVISQNADYLSRRADEWIYRRAWTYGAGFDRPAGEGRVFIRLTGLRGEYRVLINGGEAARGSGAIAEFEATALLNDINRMEIVFEPAGTQTLHPDTGFEGAASFRCCGQAAVTALRAISAASGTQVFAALELAEETQTELKITITNSDGEFTDVYTDRLGPGYMPVLREGLHALKPLETNTVSAEVRGADGTCDKTTLYVYPPDESVPARGFVGGSESLMGLGEDAGANAAFTCDEEASAAFMLLSSRHALPALVLGSTLPVRARDALLPEDLLLEVIKTESALDGDEMWYLTDARRECWDEAKKHVPSGSLANIIAYTRYEQAVDIKNKCLDARLEKRAFALADAEGFYSSPASCALLDTPDRARPACFALTGAWQEKYAFTRAPKSLPADGVFSCGVYCVGDTPFEKGLSVRVSAFALDGHMISSTAFPACEGSVGRFTVELPPDGCAIIRSELMRSSETLTVSDEAVFAPGKAYESLPGTQLLIDENRVSNAGQTAAVGVCVPGAGYFGCLLPGEYVTSDRGSATLTEGLNIYI